MISNTEVQTSSASTIGSASSTTSTKPQPQPEETGMEDDDEGVDIDFTCNVCRTDEGDEDNPLVVCEKCLICVHRECYGSPLSVEIPEDEWVCERCLADAGALPCALCPVLHGAMKRTTDYRWCHLSCAQWIPEVFFRLPDSRELVDYLTVPLNRWDRCCEYCSTKYGATMNCSHAGCTKVFHITCGMDKDIFLEYKSNNKGADVINALCSEHDKKWKMRLKRNRV